MSEYSVRPDLHLDSAALLAAADRLDVPAIERIISAHDPDDLICMLVHKLGTAVRSPKMTVEQWVDLQADKSLDSMFDDVPADVTDPWWR